IYCRACNDRPKEILLITIAQAAEVDRARLHLGAVEEAARGASVSRRGRLRHAQSGLRAGDQPVNVFGGEGRINANGVELDRRQAVGLRVDVDRHLLAVNVELQVAQISARLEARGGKL